MRKSKSIKPSFIAQLSSLPLQYRFIATYKNSDYNKNYSQDFTSLDDATTFIAQLSAKQLALLEFYGLYQLDFLRDTLIPIKLYKTNN